MVNIAVHGAVAEDGLQETCSFLLSDHHTVILTDSNTGRRRLRRASDKALWQNFTAIANLGRGWARVVMCKALFTSVTGDRHNASVRDSNIRLQTESHGRRSDAVVGVQLW